MNKIKKHLFDTSIDLGLLILRLGLGIPMMVHGWPKISGGTEMWVKLGSKMSLLGIDAVPVFWGVMAAVAEFVGGLFLLLGWLTRPASFLLAFTMLVATIYHYSEEGAGFGDASHALELMMVFIAIYMAGPGKYSMDEKLHR